MIDTDVGRAVLKALESRRSMARVKPDRTA